MRKVNKANRLIPSYIQLKQILHAEIQGSGGAGIKLPSIRSLMKFHKLSQGTVERAIFELEKDGLIERKNSLGIHARKNGAEDSMAAPAPVLSSGGGIVGIEVFDLVNFAPRIVKGAREALSAAGYLPVLFSPESGIEGGRPHFFIDLLIQNGAKGFIGMPHEALSGDYRRLRESRIPSVFIASVPEGFEADCVLNDDEHGGRLATKHLLEKGHRKILYVGDEAFAGRRRLEGFKRALAEAGADFEDRMFFRNDGPRPEAKAIYERIRKGGFTAVFAMNDVWAVELYWFLSGMGLSIPGDLALIGYDDSEIIGVSRVPLSTVAQPCFDIGARAAELLLDRIAGGAEAFNVLKLEPKLIARGTA